MWYRSWRPARTASTVDLDHALALFFEGLGALTVLWALQGFLIRRPSSTAASRIVDRWIQITWAVDASTRVSSWVVQMRSAAASMSRSAVSPRNGMMWFQILLRMGAAVDGSSESLSGS